MRISDWRKNMDIQNSEIKITINDKIKSFQYKTKAIDALKEFYTEEKLDNILAVRVNNKINAITKELVEDVTIVPLDYYDADGYKIYRRTVKLVLYLAIKRLYKDLDIELCNTIDNSSYFLCNGIEFTEEMAEKLVCEMNNIINKNYPIEKKKVDFEEAYAIFKAQGEQDKLDDMEIKIKPAVSMCFVDGFATTMYGIVAPSTRFANCFGIKKFRKGFVLIYSDKENMNSIDLNVKDNAVYNVFEEFNEYAEEMGIKTVSDLNQKIIDGEISDVISKSEQVQVNKLDDIMSNINNNVKFILVAGPSSSGKTTFAKRISSKLIERNLQPITISMDNYFKERVDTPKLPNGDYDFETVDALDMELFNRDMKALLDGQEISMPEFNFFIGKKEYHGNNIKMNANTVFVVEGIHALNPMVTEVIPDSVKYKIYIAPMAILNMDDFSKVSTTDTRVLRRMVRDFRTRGHSVDNTLNMWANIARGEKKYIYPYIKEADYIFNTSLIYEVPALSIYARPLLLQVKTSSKNYSEARRLYNFLTNFLTIDERDIPENSLLREFIG